MSGQVPENVPMQWLSALLCGSHEAPLLLIGMVLTILPDSGSLE